MAPMTARLGIAGCGRLAERGHIPAAATLPSVELTAVCDPHPDRLAQAAGLAAGAVPYSDPAEMIAAGGIDGLIVLTPAGHHLEVARLAAGAGVPSLVEKPPAPDLAGATALAALDPAPAIGFNRRFLQGEELAGAIPASGWLELDLELRFRQSGWGAHQSRDEAILDAGVHLIDLAAFLADAPPIAVRAAEVGPDRARLELELTRGRARILCAVDRAYSERVEVRDRSGATIARSRIGRLGAAAGRLRGAPDPLVASLAGQLERFAARLRGEDGGRLADAAAGVSAMAVIEAARRSHELGGAEVTVDLAPLSVGTTA
jgi:predicted dehydrogenase